MASLTVERFQDTKRRGYRRATTVPLRVVFGVRRDGRTALQAARTMVGGSEEA